MKRINITQAAAIVAVTGALAASAALAGDPAKKEAATAAASARSKPAVVFVKGTPDEIARAAQADAQATALGMRAYVDGNGRLRKQTPADVAAEAAAPQARSAARGPARRTLAAEAAAPAASVSDSGMMSLSLDESSMMYSVATIQSDGSVKEDCVPGIAAAKAAVESPAAVEGARHDH